MILTFQKDSQGNFIPATKEEIAEALAMASDIPQKRNEPRADQDILDFTLQALEEAKDVTVEELGL